MSDKSDAGITARRSGEFTFMSFVWRLLFSLILVLVTYNPSGNSVFHWIREAIANGGLDAVHFFVAALLLMGWSILWIATWRSLDIFGVIMVTLVIASLVWLLVDIGLLTTDSRTALAWIIVICVAALMGVGLSWSHIWRRLTGQYEVDED